MIPGQYLKPLSGRMAVFLCKELHRTIWRGNGLQIRYSRFESGTVLMHKVTMAWTWTPSQVIGAEQGRGEAMTAAASLNESEDRSLRKVVRLSGQLHALC